MRTLNEEEPVGNALYEFLMTLHAELVRQLFSAISNTTLNPPAAHRLSQRSWYVTMCDL